MLDVALATSAAPTYFRPHEMRVTDQDGPYRGKFIDGGIYANHPALCAFAEISAEDADAEFLIVSIGTGESPVQFGKKPNRWGIYFWARRVLNTIFDGISETVTYQLNKFLNRIGNNYSYHRFQFPLDEANKDLDNASERNVSALKAATAEFIRQHEDELNALCQRLHKEWLKRQEAP